MEKKTTDLLKKETRYSCLKPSALNLKNDSLYYRDLGETSLGFKTGAIEKAIDYFCELFKLSDKKQFDKKFRESISGDGNELGKIDAVHSSSLLALLCFYNVKNKPLYFEGVRYDDVYFEFKNKVVKNPSNMDVVLTGRNKQGEECLLFVECKYSEFFKSEPCKLGKTYETGEYRRIFYNLIRYQDIKVYQYGIKQLVTHYLGIRNFIKSDIEDYKKMMSKYYLVGRDRCNLYRRFNKVSFLEVVYDFSGLDNYDQYVKESEDVFDKLKDLATEDNLDLNLLGTTTYQNLFLDYENGINSGVLDDKVREFYFSKYKK